MAIVARDRMIECPDEIALRDERQALGWAEVNDLLNRATNALAASDLGPARRVAVYAENSVETVLAHLGGLLAGVSTVPVNFHLNADEAAYILRDSAARIVFTGPENLSRAIEAAAIAGIDTVIGWRLEPATTALTAGTADVADLADSADSANSAEPGGVAGWEAWLAGAGSDEPPTDVEPRPNLMYTSGTTGFPKGVDLAPTLFAGGATIDEHVERLRHNRFCDVGVHLVVGPMYHTGPLNGMRILAAGTPVAVAGRFDAEGTLATIERLGAASSVMVPTHFKRMLDLPAEVKARYDVSSMRIVAHTGAACPVDVKRRMIEWFGPVFIDAYGATEVGTICSITSQEWLAHPGSVGRCINPPFTRAVVVDDDGNELPAGAEGRLYFEDSTGRGIIYPNDPQKTASAHLRPGVFTIGEIGYVDTDGYVFITDRFSDMIVAGGVNIYPAEAEKVLIAHPQVADVAVIGVPHPDLGEAVKALVVPVDAANPPDPDELGALCRSHLAGYKCPRTIDIVASVGRNAMGKINKRALRAPYWDGSRTIG